MPEIVTADIGGTHARFAIARIDQGRVETLEGERVYKTADHPDLASAWAAFAADLGRSLPRGAAMAVACPVKGEVLRLTNNPWIIDRSQLPSQLGLDQLTVLNDFEAVGHAVAQVGADHLAPVCGPNRPLPENGVITVIGPGTGLGVGMVVRQDRDRYTVVSTEGGHVSFAPVDAQEDEILAHLRRHFPRVSAERVISGPGLLAIYQTLAAINNRPAPLTEDKALWEAAMGGTDSQAAAALERFFLCFGTCAGDIALAQGSGAVVIAGGLGLRLRDRLHTSGFAQRFVAKGRFESLMAALPVKLITHPQPGLYGAAAAHATSTC